MRSGVIYDFGMNNGDDVEYYLLKGGKVVGVEANPNLCRQVESRFAAEIADKRLVVIHGALVPETKAQKIDFYIHRTAHVLSQLSRPNAREIRDFDRVEVPCLSPVDTIREHGDPSYIKIDLEGTDVDILRAIFSAAIYPPEISAESHTVDVFACLVEAGYKSFNLIDGASVSRIYRKASIATASGTRVFSFKPHSAGPFGVDIRSDWQDSDTFLTTLAAAGLGWKDIHASKTIPPASPPSFSASIRCQILGLAKKLGAGFVERVSR